MPREDTTGHRSASLVATLAALLVATSGWAAVATAASTGGANVALAPAVGLTQAPATQTPALPPASAGPGLGADAAAEALAERLSRPNYTADTTAAAVEALARSGVGTYLAPADIAPELPVTGAESPVRLLDFQVHALAVDAWAGEGLTGSEVDALLPIPASIQDQTAPASAFLAGYVATVNSPGAALARALMADQDLAEPHGLHFPLIVLHLFVSDLATDGGVRSAARSRSESPVFQTAAFRPDAGTRGSGEQAGVATLCSDASKFIDSTIHALFNMLKLAVPDNTVGAILVGIWNWIVDQGEAFVRGLISAVTTAVLATVRAIAGGIAAIANQVAAMVPYVVTVRVDPAATIELGNNRVFGEFVATVSAGDLPDWPAVMKDCAATAQVALPSFRGRDEPVTWGAPISDAPGIVSLIRSDPRTNSDGEARWAFGTGPDPGDAGGPQRNSAVYLGVTIHRSALDDARKSLTNALFGGIPDILKGFVGELFGFFVDPLQQAVAALIDTHATGVALIVYHDIEPKPTPGPSVSTLPPPHRTPPPPKATGSPRPGPSLTPEICQAVLQGEYNFANFLPYMSYDEMIKLCIEQILGM